MIRAIRTAGVIVALMAQPFLVACDGVFGSPGGGEPPLDPDEFVDIMITLRQAELALAGADSADARYEERKVVILEEHGVTEEELRAFLTAHANDVALLEEVWDSIAQGLKYVPGEPITRGTGSGALPDPDSTPGPLPDSATPGQRLVPRSLKPDTGPSPGVRRLH